MPTGNRVKGNEDADLRLVRLHHLAERPNICKREVSRFDLCDHTGLYVLVETWIPNDSVPCAVKTAISPVSGVGCNPMRVTAQFAKSCRRFCSPTSLRTSCMFVG